MPCLAALGPPGLAPGPSLLQASAPQIPGTIGAFPKPASQTLSLPRCAGNVAAGFPAAPRGLLCKHTLDTAALFTTGAQPRSCPHCWPRILHTGGDLRLPPSPGPCGGRQLTREPPPDPSPVPQPCQPGGAAAGGQRGMEQGTTGSGSVMGRQHMPTGKGVRWQALRAMPGVPSPSRAHTLQRGAEGQGPAAEGSGRQVAWGHLATAGAAARAKLAGGAG